MQPNERKSVTKNPYENRRSATFTNDMLNKISEEIFLNQKKKIQEMKYLTEKCATLKIKESENINGIFESRDDTDKDKEK
jgi:hypothetical protein